MHEATVSTPDKLRDVLVDDLKRRQYVLDADVLEHTTALASIDPAPNGNGKPYWNLFWCMVSCIFLIFPFFFY
jgi:hypothetical protein